MNLHEYQAKALLAQYGIPIPAGKPAFSLREALLAAEELGGDGWMVKAQTHAGGGGREGGVRKSKGQKELERPAGQFLGSRLVPPQTGPAGQPVDRLLIE